MGHPGHDGDILAISRDRSGQDAMFIKVYVLASDSFEFLGQQAVELDLAGAGRIVRGVLDSLGVEGGIAAEAFKSGHGRAFREQDLEPCQIQRAFMQRSR